MSNFLRLFVIIMEDEVIFREPNGPKDLEEDCTPRNVEFV